MAAERACDAAAAPPPAVAAAVGQGAIEGDIAKAHASGVAFAGVELLVHGTTLRSGSSLSCFPGAAVHGANNNLNSIHVHTKAKITPAAPCRTEFLEHRNQTVR